MKAVNCEKVKNTMMYTGSPHNPRVLLSPFKHERDFTIVRSLYKPIPRLLLQSSNKTTKNNPLGFFTTLFPTILDNKISTTKNNPLGLTILIMRTILSLINNPCFQPSWIASQY